MTQFLQFPQKRNAQDEIYLVSNPQLKELSKAFVAASMRIEEAQANLGEVLEMIVSFASQRQN